MAHQVLAKNIVKTEFLLGLALSIMDAIGIDQFQHVQDKGTEIMMTLETMRSHLYRAEHNAKLDKWGTMTPDYAALDTARNWYPRVYPRLVEILRVLGASGSPPKQIFVMRISGQVSIADSKERIWRDMNAFNYSDWHGI